MVYSRKGFIYFSRRALQKRYIMDSGWRVKVLNIIVEAELQALPKDLIASFFRISQMIEIRGITQVHEPYVKHLRGPIWEMRMKGKDGIARAAYVTASGKRVVVLRIFEKKSQETPPREIALALKRAKEV